LKKLLDALGIERKDVTLLPGMMAAPRHSARAAFISEAMRPAGTTERWHGFLAAAKRQDLLARWRAGPSWKLPLRPTRPRPLP
jgi:ATP-dependent helicase/nuclease subunit B